MKYKVLLTGENKSAIDDFFLQMQASFLMLATSGRKVDILNHFEVFEPDIFVYCLNGESAKKDYNKIYMLKEEMKKR